MFTFQVDGFSKSYQNDLKLLSMGEWELCESIPSAVS